MATVTEKEDDDNPKEFDEVFRLMWASWSTLGRARR